MLEAYADYSITSRRRTDGNTREAPSPRDSSRDLTPTRDNRYPEKRDSPKPTTESSGGSYSSYKTAEDRAAFIKQQAEQRMAERLAALGLKPPVKSGESSQQRQQRETKEREDRLRQAEEEDTRRENERQRRLADERPSAPEVSRSAKKPPPTPPVRKNRADSAAQRAESRRKEENAAKARAEHEGMEKVIKDQQQAQVSETRALE